MPSFSQRKGLEPVSKLIQLDSMDEFLRNAIWNVLDRTIWSTPGFIRANRPSYPPRIDALSRELWEGFFGARVDKRPTIKEHILHQIQEWFFHAPWNKVYDFLEFILKPELGLPARVGTELDAALARNGSGYRIVDGIVVDTVSESEVDMLQETLDNGPMGVASHLRRALQLLADRDNPDYRNSIKESISAVESMAKIVTDNPKATLGQALKVLEKNGKMHPALKEGFQKLYGYASDEDGIRHAMLDEPNLTAADAKYFLMSCTSFVNYMKAQQPA
jgi:DNA-binding transcriptional ArsR family regulator